LHNIWRFKLSLTICWEKTLTWIKLFSTLGICLHSFENQIHPRLVWCWQSSTTLNGFRSYYLHKTKVSPIKGLYFSIRDFNKINILIKLTFECNFNTIITKQIEYRSKILFSITRQSLNTSLNLIISWTVTKQTIQYGVM
jgi:hypothetical protein